MNASTAVAERMESVPVPRETFHAPSATPMEMVSRALASGASVEMMEKLLALQEGYEANEARKEFDAAMAAAKAEIPPIIKNRTVDFTSQKGRTNYRHEDLGEIARTIDPILGRHGLTYRFRTRNAPNEPVSVTCIVSHRLGHFEENTLSAGRDDSGNKNSIQAIASTITYLQRYTLKAALGLAASADDDGAAADGKVDAEDSARISDDNFSTLQDLIDKTNTDIVKFCRYYKIESVSSLPANRFKEAVAYLNKRLRAK
jgi:hypothetical protein